MGRRWQLPEQRECSPEDGDRFVEGRHRHRSGSGHVVGIDGRLDHAGLVVVCGQLWAGRVKVVAELDRDRFGDGPVELTSTSGTEHLQGDRPKLVVAEVVRESLIADDPSTPELVEMVDELWLADPGGR